jgi:acyl-CoA reductase-like NAD-dependent aldehyde dehydrogenase
MKPMYLNGQWVEASDGQTIDVFNPATEEIIDRVPNGSAEDALKAVAAAKHAFNEWRWTSALERCEMLHEAARKLRRHFDEVAELLTLEEGKAISENEEEVEWTIGTMDYYAEMIRNYRADDLESGSSPGRRQYGHHQTLRPHPSLHPAPGRNRV